MTAGDRLIPKDVEQSIQLAVQLGIALGIALGIQQGERAVLLRLLRQRFGHHVYASVEQRLATASARQIATWVDCVLSAATLGELLAD